MFLEIELESLHLFNFDLAKFANLFYISTLAFLFLKLFCINNTLSIAVAIKKNQKALFYFTRKFCDAYHQKKQKCTCTKRKFHFAGKPL